MNTPTAVFCGLLAFLNLKFIRECQILRIVSSILFKSPQWFDFLEDIICQKDMNYSVGEQDLFHFNLRPPPQGSLNEFEHFAACTDLTCS